MNNSNKYKPLIIVLSSLLIFGIFIWSLTGTSEYDIAREELNTTSNYDDVKKIWVKYNSNLKDRTEWYDDVKNQLEGLYSKRQITSKEVEELPSWFPVRQHLNLIIVPDLSGRLAETENPGQIHRDKEIIQFLWQGFKSHCNQHWENESQSQSADNKIEDRFIIDATDRNVAQGQFEKISNTLIFDLSKTEKGPSPYLTQRENDFITGLDKLYSLSEQARNNHECVGADYTEYFDNLLIEKKPTNETLCNRFRNVVILLTDGYLETCENRGTIKRFTGEPSQLDALKKVIANTSTTNDNSLQTVLNNLRFPKYSPKNNFNNWEVLVLEVRDRQGRRDDYASLKAIWTSWLTNMNFKLQEDFFKRHSSSSELTKDGITKFLNIRLLPSASGNAVVQNSISSDTVKFNTYLKEAAKQIKDENFASAKLILHQAIELKQERRINGSWQETELYNTCLHFAEKAYISIIANEDFELIDVPLNYFEIAQLLKPSSAVQKKIDDCRIKYQKVKAK